MELNPMPPGPPGHWSSPTYHDDWARYYAREQMKSEGRPTFEELMAELTEMVDRAEIS